MEWDEMFGSARQPDFADMESYIGGEGLALWQDLFVYMQKAYGAKPKMSYSACSGKPGWNVKFRKSGQSFGTLYPEKNAFSVFIVIGYKLDAAVELLRPALSDAMRARYDAAQDYMKMGRWMMFQITGSRDLDDYKALMSVKLAPKG